MSFRRFRISDILNFAALISVFALTLGCAKPQYVSLPASGTNEKIGSGSCIAEFQISKTCIGLNWEKMPTETEFGSFVFTITGEAGLLADPGRNADGSVAAPKVVLWMPSMGHGSAPVAVERISTGLYRAKNVFFTMKGEWEIRFQIPGDQAIRAVTL